MSEGVNIREFGRTRLQLGASMSAFEVFQSPTGQAAVYDSPRNTSGGVAAGSANDYIEPSTAGTYMIFKTANIVLLKGGRVYWDHSANTATYKKVNDRDFYVGRATEDAAAAATTALVSLNEDPPYDIDIARDPCLSVLVGTAAAGAFGYPVRRGGCFILELTATSEAQKVDLLSRDGFDLAANPIVEFAFLIENDGSNATQDFTIGVASGTHASDFQTITSFVAVSTVGASTNLNVQSDDNVTDVAPVDSTIDYTEGTAVAQRVEGWLDFRDPADVQCYLNGALVLSASTFTAGTSGTHFLIAHLEKTTGTDVYKVAVEWLRVRLSEQ